MLAPDGTRPVKVALVMDAGAAKTKSSAASISGSEPFPGREAIAMLPFGAPVVKVMEIPSAKTGPAMRADSASDSKICVRLFIFPSGLAMLRRGGRQLEMLVILSPCVK
jgi:hypothetical protein